MRAHTFVVTFLAAAVLLCSQALAEGPFRLRGHEGGVTSLSFSPGGKVLVSTGPDSVKVWDLATRTSILSYNSGTGNVYYLSAFSPDGTLLAVHGLEGAGTPRGKQVIITWDTATWKKKQTFELPVTKARLMALSSRPMATGWSGARWTENQDSPAGVSVTT